MTDNRSHLEEKYTWDLSTILQQIRIGKLKSVT
ncbi:oligopeptidase [Streptococcus pyogenes]|nr:oligopeptidase [Streptococcus pyogenes]